jgi:hypothetical protein
MCRGRSCVGEGGAERCARAVRILQTARAARTAAGGSLDAQEAPRTRREVDTTRRRAQQQRAKSAVAATTAFYALARLSHLTARGILVAASAAPLAAAAQHLKQHPDPPAAPSGLIAKAGPGRGSRTRRCGEVLD